MAHPIVGQLGDVDQALDLRRIHQPGERPEFGQLGHGGLDKLVNLVIADHLLPRVVFLALQAQADALALAVDADHLGLDFLPHFQNLAGVGDVAPRQLGQVHQAIRAAQVDERAKIGQADHAPFADLADGQLVQQARFLLLAPFARRGALGQDQAVARAVDLDHFHGNIFADHAAPAFLRAFAHRAALPLAADLAGGHEAAHLAKAHDQAALVVAGHFAEVHLLALMMLDCHLPVVFFFGAGQRQHRLAIWPLRAQDVHPDRAADLERLQRGTVHAFELAAGDRPDHALAQVHLDLGRAGRGNGALDDDAAANTCRFIYRFAGLIVFVSVFCFVVRQVVTGVVLEVVASIRIRIRIRLGRFL